MFCIFLSSKIYKIFAPVTLSNRQEKRLGILGVGHPFTDLWLCARHQYLAGGNVPCQPLFVPCDRATNLFFLAAAVAQLFLIGCCPNGSLSYKS